MDENNEKKEQPTPPGNGNEAAKPDQPSGASTPPRRWKPLLFKGAIGLAGLLLLALVVLRLAAPGIARSQGERILSDLLQTDVQIEKVRLSLLGRSAGVEGLRVANLEGFGREDILNLDRLHASVGLFSLMTSRPHIREVELEGLRVNLETRRDGERNLYALLQRIEETMEEWEEEDEAKEDFEDEEEEEEEKEKDKAPSGLRVSRVALKDIEIRVRDFYARPEAMQESSMVLASLEIHNLLLPDNLEQLSDEQTRLTVAGLRLSGPDRFQSPTLLYMPDFRLAAQVERLFQTLPEPEIRVALLEDHGTRVSLESFSEETKTLGQNVAEFAHLFANALDPEPPLRMGEERVRPPKEKQPHEEWPEDVPPGEEPDAPPAEEPVIAEEEPEVPAEEDWGRVEVAKLLMDDLEIVSTMRGNRDRVIPLRDGRIEALDVTYPQVMDRPAELLISFVSGDPGTLLRLRGEGALADSTFQGPTLLLLEAEEYPLGGIPNVQSGRLTTRFEAAIQDARLDGNLRFRLKRFDLDEKDSATRVLVESLRVLDAADRPLAFPIWFNLPSDARGGEGWSTFLERLVDAILGSIGTPLASAVEEAGRQVEEAARLIEAGGREIEGAVDKLRENVPLDMGRATGAIRDAEGAVRDAEGAVRGIFGGRRSQEQEED